MIIAIYFDASLTTYVTAETVGKTDTKYIKNSIKAFSNITIDNYTIQPPTNLSQFYIT